MRSPVELHRPRKTMDGISCRARRAVIAKAVEAVCPPPRSWPIRHQTNAQNDGDARGGARSWPRHRGDALRLPSSSVGKGPSPPGGVKALATPINAVDQRRARTGRHPMQAPPETGFEEVTSG